MCVFVGEKGYVCVCVTECSQERAAREHDDSLDIAVFVALLREKGPQQVSRISMTVGS
jgi:hypothetical protein